MPFESLIPADTEARTEVGGLATATRRWMFWRAVARHWRRIALAVAAIVVCGGVALGLWYRQRYAVAEVMNVAVREFTNAEYPADPSGRSIHAGEYTGRTLELVHREGSHFDFIFKPLDEQVATVTFRDVDVSLMTPSLPEWCKSDEGLERIALTDRQWNRQQVRFDPKSAHVEVSGGDGFERENLYSAELAKNCLNAGLWEILLFEKEHDGKAMYYQGWFTFPLGQYAEVFESNTGLPYRKHWYKLEHWSDPQGTPVALDKLRQATSLKVVDCRFDPDERLIVGGEQVRKRRTMDAANVVAWKDFSDGRPVTFATFTPPGVYDLDRPWENQYWRLAKFEDAVLRKVRSPGSSQELDEIELRFRSSDGAHAARFFVSGFRIDELPQLPVSRYSEGMYMPMGIGVPPFSQSYEDLQHHRPSESPYFSVLLDEQDQWLNHHEIAIDGPVLHRDERDATLVHLYLLSYERHSLIGHWVIDTKNSASTK